MLKLFLGFSLVWGFNAFSAPVWVSGREPLRWQIGPGFVLHVYVSSVSSTDIANAEYAMAQWQSVPTSYIQFERVTDASRADIAIEWLSSLSNPAAGGQAIPRTDGRGGMTYCSIEILQSSGGGGKGTLTHELGHCLGLHHSIVDGAIMSYRGGGTVLTDDDKMAISRLYPQNGSGDLPQGCAGYMKTPSDNDGGPFNGPLLMSALLMMTYFYIRSFQRKRLFR